MYMDARQDGRQRKGNYRGDKNAEHEFHAILLPKLRHNDYSAEIFF
jgi:hypothetical protein